MNRCRTLRVLACTGLALLLGACASSGPVPEDQFYRLGALAAEQSYASPPIAGVLKVERMDAYGIFRERAVLFSYADTPEAVKRHHYHHWVDAPPTLLRDQLVAYLRAAGVATTVAGGVVEMSGDVRLRLELKDFTRVLKTGGAVQVRVALDLVVMARGQAAPSLIRSYAEQMAAADATMPASVRAFDAVLAKLYARLLDDLVQAL